jgi:hypothetical protein
MEASFFNDQMVKWSNGQNHQKKIFLKRLGEIYLYDYNIVKNEIFYLSRYLDSNEKTK